MPTRWRSTAADRLLTARGARTAPAAVAARQLGKVCLVGCRGLAIDTTRRMVQLGGQRCSIASNNFADRAEAVGRSDGSLLAAISVLRAPS